MRNRVISLIMAVVLAFSIFPYSVFAADDWVSQYFVTDSNGLITGWTDAYFALSVTDRMGVVLSHSIDDLTSVTALIKADPSTSFLLGAFSVIAGQIKRPVQTTTSNGAYNYKDGNLVYTMGPSTGVAGGGRGENPTGYAGQGQPAVSSSGSLIYRVPMVSSSMSFYRKGSVAWDSIKGVTSSNGESGTVVDFSGFGSSVGASFVLATSSSDKLIVQARFSGTAPISGNYKYLSSNYFIVNGKCDNSEIDVSLAPYFNSWNSSTVRSYSKGDSIADIPFYYSDSSYKIGALTYASSIYLEIEPLISNINKVTNITVNNNIHTGDNIYYDTTNKIYYDYSDSSKTNIYYADDAGNVTSNITYDGGTNNYYITVYNVTEPTPTPSSTPEPTPEPTAEPTATSTPTETPVPSPIPGDGTKVFVVGVGTWWADFTATLQGFFNGLAAGIAAGFANLSANFTLAIDNLSINFQKIINQKFPDPSTPETAPTASPTPSATPAPTATPEIAPTASPTPSATPAPTATPETAPSASPSPTVPPGSGSGGSVGTSPSWSNPFSKILDMLAGMLWGLLSIFLAILKFILWLVSIAGSLFPFLPTGAFTMIGATLVIIFVLAVIHFIRRG